jgi:hypothetical protein
MMTVVELSWWLQQDSEQEAAMDHAATNAGMQRLFKCVERRYRVT